MGMIQEFKEFAMKGNVVDLAVGVIMGAAFSPIVSTLVDNIIMPPIGYLMAGVDFSTLAVSLPTPTDPILIKYGLFLNAVIKFLITARATGFGRRFILVNYPPPATRRLFFRSIFIVIWLLFA